MKSKFKLTEQDYRYLFENASDAMWVHDMDGNFLDANRAFERLSGYALEKWGGINVIQFLDDEALALAGEVRRKLLGGEEIEQPYEQRFILKDGTTKIVKMATSPVIIDGEVKGFQHVARDITEEKQMQERMHYYVQQITRVQEDERKRVARVLHDDMASPILLLIQRLDKIASRTHPKLSDSLKDSLEDLRNQAVEALEGLRRCAQGLRPRILDDLGLIPALEWMAEDLTEYYGIDTHVEIVSAECSLSDETQMLLFRIVQEALSNIRRHSGASKAEVKLEFESKQVRVTIHDNGHGFDIPTHVEDLAGAGKLGVIGMHERARLLGGSLKVQSKLGKGTQVVAEIPLPG